MDETLSGKVVLVTGGAKRVGAAICRLLHARGAQVMVHHRASVDEARALQADLNARRADSVALVQADLLNGAGLQELVKTTIGRFGRLDVLVNNASSFFPTPVGDITEEAWDDLVGTNLKAPLFLSQAAAPELRKRHGCIVNIVDIHAEFPMKNYVVYTVAKGGLLALTRSLARELGSRGITVNCVAPGFIATDMTDALADDQKSALLAQIPLGRLGSADDVAQAVAFLVSAGAGYITGTELHVNGGMYMN